MTTPLVSILIPAYNADRFLAQTLRSALDQTWPRKEILLIDDGSSDRTYETAMTFANRDLKVIRQGNRGACATRNRLLELSQGDYIQWLDADDLLTPSKITNQMKLRAGNAESRTLLTSAWGSFFYRTSKAKFSPSGLWRDLSPTDWITTKFMECSWMNPTAWLVSRRLSEMVGPWDPRLASSGDDDGEYVVRIAAASDQVRFVPDSICYYRMGVSGSLNWDLGADRKRLEALCCSLELSVQHLLDLADTAGNREAGLTYLRRWASEFYGADEEILRKFQSLGSRLGGKIEGPAAPWKYRLIEKLLGDVATASVMRKWRKGKLHVHGAVDRWLWRIWGNASWRATPASLG
jgi:glycosyltransferase involved in cell wall biosynthesis